MAEDSFFPYAEGRLEVPLKKVHRKSYPSYQWRRSTWPIWKPRANAWVEELGRPSSLRKEQKVSPLVSPWPAEVIFVMGQVQASAWVKLEGLDLPDLACLRTLARFGRLPWARFEECSCPISPRSPSSIGVALVANGEVLSVSEAMRMGRSSALTEMSSSRTKRGISSGSLQSLLVRTFTRP